MAAFVTVGSNEKTRQFLYFLIWNSVYYFHDGYNNLNNWLPFSIRLSLD